MNLVVKILISCVFLIQSIFGSYTYENSITGFTQPEQIDFDSNGNIYVADSNQNMVKVYSPSGAHIRNIGSQGGGDGEMYYPQYVSVDRSNNVVYISSRQTHTISGSQHKVQKFTLTGTYLGKLTCSSVVYGLVVDQNTGHVWISFSGKAKKYTSSFSYVAETNSSISDYGDLAIDSSGNLYAPTGYQSSTWKKFNSSGTYLSSISFPTSVNTFTFGHDGKIYAVQDHALLIINSSYELISLIGTSGYGALNFSYPQKAILNPVNSKIYVSDMNPQRVKIYLDLAIDTDGDDFPDAVDAFPSDPTEWVDTDDDGVGDNIDAFPSDPTEWVDTDDDGVGDNSDAFPNDPTRTGLEDTDGDGIPNNEDDFPNDATVAVASRYPSESQYIGSLLFEDSWPYAGDYDMNDVYMGYKFETQLNNSNEVKKIKAFFTLRAAGAGFRNGFGIQFPHIELGNVENVKFYRNGELINSNFQSEVGQSKPTYIISPSIYGDIPGDSRLVNVTDSSTFDVAVDQLPYYELEVTLINPDPYVGNAPYNPFIFVNQDRGREVHLPNHPPTDLANNAYYGTVHDQVNGEGVSRYLTSSAYGQAGLPWALDIPVEFEPPLEKTDIVEAYPNIVNWAQSATFGEIEGGGAWTVDDPELSTWYQSGNNAKRRQVNTVLRSRDQSVLSGKFGF